MSKAPQVAYDVIVLGGGAAGLMCAIEAGKRGRRVIVLERGEKVGKKILISGGGRCNFTNRNAAPHTYRCQNPHFHKSALARYTPFDFIRLVEAHGVPYYEKKLGQLFCKDTARRIVDLLLKECASAGVTVRCNTQVLGVAKEQQFVVETDAGLLVSDAVVVATGGLSIPKMGATGFGYALARQFGLNVTEWEAGLVPFVFGEADLKHFDGLAGIAIDAEVACNGKAFRENILVTHRGVSGPAILQISSYWKKGDVVNIDLLPGLALAPLIEKQKVMNDKLEIKTVLGELLPKRFVNRVFELWLSSKPLRQLSAHDVEAISEFFHKWQIKPVSTEGYRTAEVTLGGVDTDALSSKTFECKTVPGLYFIGEVLDVTGWLGGYNLQWAWSSGWCAGQYV